MRSMLLTAGPAVILGALLLSCSTGQKEQPVNPAETYESITIQSPMTVSGNYLFPASGKDHILRIKLVKGRYYEDWYPGPVMGSIWEGEFVAELADEYGNAITQTDLSRFFDEPLVFNSHFQLEFDDYNEDGDVDFTIGQYASSNGRHFKLFTLRQNGTVEELPIPGHAPLFISQYTGAYSTRLEKIEPAAFKTVHYDMSKQKNVEHVFRWNGEAFVLADTRETDP
jgi:bla regulator protein BlaR1